MSRAAACLSGAALLLAVTGTTASAAPHAPRTERISTAADGTQADGPSSRAAISADGRHVTFTSTAPGFGCARFTPCLLTKDLTTGEVSRIDLGSGNSYDSPMPSADGSRIAFSAGTRFLAPYLYDRATGRAERLWPQDPPGSNELGRVQSISPDGTHIAYTIGNRHGPENTRLLYVRDTATGTDELVSPAEEGSKGGASVSGDGRRVAYSLPGSSEETDPRDVFVKDRRTGERTQVDAGLGVAHLVRITADGHRVLLNAGSGVYVHDLRTGESRRVADGTASSATADGRYAVVSGEDGTRVRDLRTGRKGAALPGDAQVTDDALAAGGRAVAFSSPASHLVPSVTERISLTAGGQQRSWASYDPVMGEDGAVTFTSEGSVFVNASGGISQVNVCTQKPSSDGTPCYSGRMVGYLAPSEADGGPAVHIRNRAVGKLTTLGSYQGVRFTWMGQPAVDPTGKAAGNPSINYDGRYIAFEQGGDLYVRDLDTGALEKAGENASAPSLSADGRKVAFQQGRYVRVRDLDTGATTRVKGAQPSLSSSGTHVAYASRGAVYLLELSTGKRDLISVDRWGGGSDLPAGHPSVNADGTVVAFESASPDLVEEDTNGVPDVFLRTVP